MDRRTSHLYLRTHESDVRDRIPVATRDLSTTKPPGSPLEALGLRWVAVVAVILSVTAVSPGCIAIRNGWLDPTILGDFENSTTMEIRSSLTLEDTPLGIPSATNPLPEDLDLVAEEYTISAGDTLAIEIHELRDRQIPYQTQSTVSATGYVNLPVLGQVQAADMTVPTFQDSLSEELIARDVLLHPQVTVNPLFLHAATYSIFGIGVSASNTAPLRAGTFPIRRPNLRLLEAINQVGGLNEFVTEIYIFRGFVHPDNRGGNIDQSEVDNAESTQADDEVAPDALIPVDHSGIETEANTTSSELSPEAQALMDALEGDEPEPEAEAERHIADVPDVLEPDPTQPFLWVDGEFVPNPDFAKSPEPRSNTVVAAPTLEGPAPTVNWARLAGDMEFRIIHVTADRLRGGDPQANIFVRPGDVIRIVSGEIGVYYMMGQVIRVGPFAFNAESITLKAAIAAAGGLAPLAWPDRCTVYRRLGGREQMIQVDLDRVFAGKDADFLIRRGDIINVGTHPFAPFLRTIRGMSIPNPVSNIGYSFTYARNFADIDSFAVQQNPANIPREIPRLFP